MIRSDPKKMMSASPNSSAISSKGSGTSTSTTSSSGISSNAKAQANSQDNNRNSGPADSVVNNVATNLTAASSTSISSVALSSSTTNDTVSQTDHEVDKSKPHKDSQSAYVRPDHGLISSPPPAKANEFLLDTNTNHSDSRQRRLSLARANERLSHTNLYIRGLQTTTKDQDLHDMCNRFGLISSTKAILDKATGFCKGYGFVEFVTPIAAELAVRELTKSGVQAQMAKVSSSYSSHNQHRGGNSSNSGNDNHQYHSYQNHHQYSSHNQRSNHKNGGHVNNSSSQHNHNSSSNSSHKNYADPTNLYIANLPPNMSETELEELLSKYGNIVSTRILRDESNNPRGVGFARMESRDKCEEIIEQLNGRPYKGSSEPLVVKFADGSNKKRHHYNNNQQQHNNNTSLYNNLARISNYKVMNHDEIRWQDGTNQKELGSIQHYDRTQDNMSHSNQQTDLALMGPMRMQPGFPPNLVAGSPFPQPLIPPSSAPQWIHSAGGQPYVVSPQMTQTSGLSPSSQAAAAAAAATAMHYGHIPHLAAQMQGLQIAHASAPVGGYLPPQPQWPPMWPHPIPQQSPNPMGRVPAGLAPVSVPSQHPPQMHRPQPPPQQQQQVALVDDKLHVPVPQG